MVTEPRREHVASPGGANPDFRHLPPRIPMEDMSTAQAASAPPDPEPIRDPHRQALFDTAN